MPFSPPLLVSSNLLTVCMSTSGSKEFFEVLQSELHLFGQGFILRTGPRIGTVIEDGLRGVRGLFDRYRFADVILKPELHRRLVFKSSLKLVVHELDDVFRQSRSN